MATYEERVSNIEKEYSLFRKLLNIYETGLQNKGWENSETDYENVCLSDFANIFDNLKYIKPDEITGCSYFDYPMYCRSFDENKNISFGVTPDIGFTKNVQLDIDTMTYLPTIKEKYKAYKVSEVQDYTMKSALGSSQSKGGLMRYAIIENNLLLLPNSDDYTSGVLESPELKIPDPFYNKSYTFFVIPRNENYMNNLFVFATYYRSRVGLSLYVTSDFFHWNTHQILPDDISSADAKLFINTTSSSLSLSDENAVIIEECLLKYFHVLPNNQYMIMYPYQMYKQDGEYKNAMSVLYSPYHSNPLMIFNDPYTDNDWENKAKNGISAFLNFNGEYVMYYNNRTNCPISLGLGTITNSAMLKDNGDVVNVPKVAKWFNIYNASGDTVFDLSTVESGKKPVLECAITTLNSISGNYSVNNFPAAMVSIATGDIKNVNETGVSEEFNDYRSLVLYLEKQSEYMGNIDEDLSSNLSGNFDSDIMEKTFDSKIDNNMSIKYEKYGNTDDYIIRSTDFGNTLIETNRKEHHQVKPVEGFIWKETSNGLSKRDWYDICYGKDKYVAICGGLSSKAFAYSIDGINWTEISNEITKKHCNSICYGKDKFVVSIGGNENNGTIFAYSTDGINWTEIKYALEETLIDYGQICYGNGIFVYSGICSIGDIGIAINKIAYSTDGINWNLSSKGLSTRQWYYNCYGNGKFIVNPTYVGGTDTFAYSTDGINWKEFYTNLSNDRWHDICYGNGKFVIISSVNTFAYSTDGINWTETSNGLTKNEGYVDICYGNGKYVAVAQNSNTFAYSSDGITWTETTNGLSEREWTSICYGNGKYVATSDKNSNVFAYLNINYT